MLAISLGKALVRPHSVTNEHTHERCQCENNVAGPQQAMPMPTCPWSHHNDWTDGSERQSEGGPAHKDGNTRGLFTCSNRRTEWRLTHACSDTVMGCSDTVMGCSDPNMLHISRRNC